MIIVVVLVYKLIANVVFICLGLNVSFEFDEKVLHSVFVIIRKIKSNISMILYHYHPVCVCVFIFRYIFISILSIFNIRFFF